MALLLDEPRLAGTERERLVLQRALAAAVADRAVERVVDQQELEDAVLRSLHRVGSACCTTMPSVTGVVHAGGKPRTPSTSTRHMRHMPTGFMRSCQQKRGM